MRIVTLELNVAENTYLALQSAGLNRAELGAHAIKDLAVQLYAEGRLSLGKAAKLANLPLYGFWLLLNERDVPVFNYSNEDYEADSATVQRIMAKEGRSQ